MNFQIQQPNHELTEGYLITFIKITVIFFLGWMIGIMIIYTYPILAWSDNRFPPALIFLDKYHIFSWIFSLLTLFLNFKQMHRKSSIRLITNFNFDDQASLFTMELLNYCSVKTSKEKIEYAHFKIGYEEKIDKLYSKQRIFHILNYARLITSLNLGKSEWRKHIEIDSLIEKLEDFNGNKL